MKEYPAYSNLGTVYWLQTKGSYSEMVKILNMQYL